ncbi:olfactory receptor 5P67-like [Loxodonta africana]|uniref:olfactory receptor 5P67-like n=1 Tax=Loxodonta africana TaxID=9785 RepID=UPI0030CF7EA3
MDKAQYKKPENVQMRINLATSWVILAKLLNLPFLNQLHRLMDSPVDGNHTAVTEFILLGLTEDPTLRVTLFMVVQCICLVTISGNLSTIILIRISPQLHHPMYLFLSHLALTDIGYSSSVKPSMLVNFLVEKNTISYLGCGIQLGSAAFFGPLGCFLLAAMAYDHFVAICNPLLYSTKMSTKVLAPSFSAGSIIVVTVFVIAISYVYNLIIILKMHSTEGRHKPFSTCTSHLTTVTVFYGTITFIYTLNPDPLSTGQPVGYRQVSQRTRLWAGALRFSQAVAEAGAAGAVGTPAVQPGRPSGWAHSALCHLTSLPPVTVLLPPPVPLASACSSSTRSIGNSSDEDDWKLAPKRFLTWC